MLAKRVLGVGERLLISAYTPHSRGTQVVENNFSRVAIGDGV